MSTKNESGLPISNNDDRTTSSLLPKFYRTDSNKKFLSATLDQLTKPGTVKKLTGYIGRQNAKSVNASDIFVKATDADRQNYQLEPTAVIEDQLGNVDFYKDYVDHINHVKTNGGITNDHNRINKQEFYAWNPNICWDKFVNFQQYYWLPYGPAAIEVQGQQQEIESTYTVAAVDEGDNYAFLFSPDGLTRNPTLTLYRGQTYNFSINSPNNPFTIKTIRVAGELEKYTIGVSASTVETGIITFKVPLDAPDVLFYVSEADANTGGVLEIKDIDENAFLDVNADILGKKTYTLSNGVPLANGMKLSFTGQVVPEQYETGYWYVEGVGSAIKLVNQDDLEIISSYSEEQALLFDDEPFDKSPFSTLTSFPKVKDYIIINRSSVDRNQWSRYNRWFHQDVITATANINGIIPEFDQTQRATRPIIEFNAGLKLFNFGFQSKKNVDVIDTFTDDVFSTIEGTLGYNIDGVPLADGMRVLFTADPDRYVNGKIFKVNFVTITLPGRQIEFNAFSEVNDSADIITFSTAHGLITGYQVTYLNNGNDEIAGLTNRKIYYVSVINDTQIRLFTDKNFINKVDIFAIGDGIHKLEVFSGYRRQINLVEDDDATPVENQTVLVKLGNINQGKMYWYNGTTWLPGQLKTTVNQPPLFDIFDENNSSYGDASVYEGTTFLGTKLFSYKVGTGTNDAELFFPLTYRNINNTGDIVFEFNLLNESFNYKKVATLLSKNTSIGYLKIISDINTFEYQNGWTKSQINIFQPIVRIFKETGLVNNFPIDVYDFKDNLDDLQIKVYINGKRQNRETFSIEDGVVDKSVKLLSDVTSNDVVTLKCYSAQPKNENGYYEIPVNLQNNPLNESVTQFTLGEVIDHVDSIVENLQDFIGVYPGNSNLQNLGNITPFGTRFVQHTGPVNFSMYHLGSETSNVLKALAQASTDYGKFKRSFLTFASESGIDTDPRRHVDFILQTLFKDKTKTQPYYLSDMFPYLGSTRLEYVVLDSRVKTYPLTTAFNLKALSNKSVIIYLNEQQLLHGRDYVFGDDVFFTILAPLAENDIIEAFEYETTDGAFCPPTPTKLGLYPLFEPKIYVDNTYLEPTTVIQGHDGSITIGYDDYRDQLLLELEMRIFNNIKISYDAQIFDIYNFIPGYTRNTSYSKAEFDLILSQFFFQWTAHIPQDYTKQNNELWSRLNPFTWNYGNNFTPDNRTTPAFWRGVYRWVLDTDRPHTHPWECLGFSIEPAWWQDVYGPAPYTSNNFILWNDIRYGLIREPGKPIRTQLKFAKSILEYGYPVDEDGNLLDPYNSGYINGVIKETSEGFYAFGDVGPVESAWRKSSYYTFAVIHAALLMQPNYVLGTTLDRSRIIKNNNDQLVYSETMLRLRLKDLVFPSTSVSTSRVFTAGLINYIVDYLTSDTVALINQYKTDLSSLTMKLGSKLGGFTSKEKFKLLLDSKSISSSGGVFVPPENYKIVLNKSSPTKKISYSGVAITKYADGYEVRGYNVDQPYFIYYPYSLTGKTINVGGISESYINWSSDKYYVAGKLIRANGQYYRVKITHQSGSTFDTSYFTRLAELPVTGGREAEMRKTFNTEIELRVSYGTKFNTIQGVVDFLQGYGAYLENTGFVFDEFNTSLKTVDNWDNAVKEFLFWTTQNWAIGAIISLSPAANNLILKTTYEVVDNVLDSFYEYKIFRVDGLKLEPELVNLFRDKDSFILTPVTTTNHGIYGASLYLVQKEHVILLDNTTLFNDVIYDQEPGYRQERIKVLGYISTEWNGGFNIPGFIYDQARLQVWSAWTDYNLGDIVKYKEFYYTASKFLVGTETFESQNWILLDEKPESRLLPNWEYKTMQFTDFYSLDSDNFDAGQQKMAQHLIGYQKRQYLENIIQDDVSQYKFYQGMIIEKGTQNVFSKLFDVLSADDQESLTFNEEWAVRVGNYGAIESYKEIEFKLDERLFKLNPQPFELTSYIDPNVVDFVYRQLPTDIYIKPLGYTNNLWATDGTISFLRKAGYVRYDDVAANVDTLDNIVGKDISNFIDGDYVWSAFEGRDWNVYRFTKSEFRVENVTYANSKLTITADRIPNIIAGDIIGLENSELVKGFYKVTSVSLATITITTTIANWISPFADLDTIVVYQFNTARVDHIDNANSILPTRLKDGELIWSDNNGSGLFSVYKNNKSYQKNTLSNFKLSDNTNYGRTVALSPNARVAWVATAESNIIVYTKNSTSTLWVATSEVLPDSSISDLANLNFGSAIAFTPDNVLTLVSASTASNVDGSTLSNQGYVGIYYRATEYSWDLLAAIESQTPAANEKFGSAIAAAKQGDDYILAVSALGATNKGKVYFYKSINGVISNYATPLVGLADNDLFGSSLEMSDDGTVLVVAAPGVSNSTGAVYIYKLVGNSYVLFKTLNNSTIFTDANATIATADQFGNSISLSASGQYLAIGAPLSDTNGKNTGKVYIFSSDLFELSQIIFSSKQEELEKFGGKVDFLDEKTLAIFSTNGDSELITTFDEALGTTFDNNSLTIRDKHIDSGRLDIYERVNNTFIFANELPTQDNISELDLFGYSLSAASGHILVGAPNDSGNFNKQGSVYAYSKASTQSSWSVLYEEKLRPNTAKIKKAYLYDRTKNELAAYLDVVDPIQGKIPGPADQEISYKTFFDPAVYSIGTSSVNVDDGMSWTTAQIGTLWWDLTNAKFIENSLGGVVYRSTTWNTLYETASIDVYEWVETKYTPDEWDKLSGTDKGNGLGVSGISKYGTSVYSVKKKYDTVSKTFKNTYYFWVKNPTFIPNNHNRKLSAYNVSRLISDPVSEGYSCIALTGSDSFSLVNVTNFIDSTNFNLVVQYWNVDLNYSETNAHSQWKILSEHPNTIIPPEVEKKWIHSLVGKDDNDRVVPDIKLPFKQRYGIGFRPRQSMFVNRVEALKQYIDRVNSVLSTKLIADDYDLSDLSQFNNSPIASSGTWDIQIDTETELRFVGTATLERATLTPIIENGRIAGAEITNPGKGYVNAPYVSISNTGRNAQIKTVVNAQGQISGVTILNSGEGYTDNTTMTLRSFTVLVASDSTTFNRWSTYFWESSTLSWERLKGQSYDVRNYWSYKDWYSTGYNQFTKIDYVVDNTYQLAILESDIGNIVKVNNVGTGGWLLLEKYNNKITIDYTQNYTVVGRQNGTIAFNSNLYSYAETGYDSNLFDGDSYDILAETELKIIINTIKNKILIDEYRVEYLKLFFSSIRYALHEQTLIDWAFKTSFVKATHNVGKLTQKVNYNNDNLENYEDYIKEVKPYRTQIREYVSSYSSIDTQRASVTDFDLLPIIDEKFEVSPMQVLINDQGNVETVNPELYTYPWKHWYDNVGFLVQSIELIDGGSGYISNPVVRIEGGFGSGATALAYISNGRVNRIQLTTPGSGYLKAPTIILDGGLGVDGVAARASVVIESEVVRSNKIAIKFDRITSTYYITEITETETFTGTGSKVQFALKFSPVSSIGESSVTVNGIDVLRDEYVLTTKKSTAKGFTSYSGLLTLSTAPNVNDVIEITYKKNFNHLSAADRINFYYNPESGMYGKDLAQLMTGVDYGGVNITGLGFNVSGGWDSLPWFTDSWDGFDAAFDDYIVTVGDSTYSFTLPYTPAVGEKINVYVNGTRIDDPYFNSYDGSTVQPNGRTVAPTGTVMQTITGDGITSVYNLPNLTDANPIDINEGDKIIFRKQSSDGSVTPLPGEYDTALSGGKDASGFIGYQTATGLAPDDIILDGDGFVTPMTSHAPEEVVPGQITDAVAIKVFQLPTSGSAKIAFTNYIANGVTNEFALGQIPNNFASIIVKVNNLILAQTDDYTINWQSQTVTLLLTPADKTIISVITFGVAADNLLDTNYFVSDGSTLEYITNASWIEGLGSIVLVNGLAVTYSLFRTTDSYNSPERVGIRFGEAVEVDALITYMITTDQNQTAAIVKIEEIIGDGSTRVFDLTNAVGIKKPYNTNVLVVQGGTVLDSGDSAYFVLNNNILAYNLPAYKFHPTVVDIVDLEVYLDGTKLNYGSQFYYNVETLTIILTDATYKDGAELIVTSYKYALYRIDNNQLTLNDAPFISDSIKVYSFYNHDIYEIQRTSEYIALGGYLTGGTYDYFRYKDLTSGRFSLNKMVAFDDYVWVIKNGRMLTHSVDYYLDSDLKTIKMAEPLTLTDMLDVICFSDRIVNASYGYMQFKDMLNRTHYKRISKIKSTKLSRDVLQTDKEILVEDGATLSPPNPAQNLPGIIEINGERIEYFTKVGNVLGQLRRATLGTGAPSLHRIRSVVLDIGPSETIPYTDSQIVETTVGDGSSNNVLLNYSPEKTSVNWYTNTIPSGYGRSDELDVFVGGIRLKKSDYKLFKETNGHPYSPEGDSQFEAEFSVDGVSSAVRLTADVPEHTKIVVVKKQGNIWHPEGTDLTYFDGEIANFIKNTEAIFSQYLVDKYQYVLATDDGVTLLTDNNEPLELD